MAEKKEYFIATKDSKPYALHCSGADANYLRRVLPDISPCSKAEYQKARSSGALSYADIMKEV